MASTTLDEIKKIFSWNPPPLIHKMKPSKTMPSTATRPPAFYDKHFSPNFVVKKVVPLPSLLQDLARNVDKALYAALETLPPLSEGFITAKRREHEMRYFSSNVVTDENAVADFYAQSTAKYCTYLASMLALHPSAPLWSSLLRWTQSPLPSAYAIMGGELRFVENADEQYSIRRAAIVEGMNSKFRPAFEELRESMSCVATWEFTSVPTGSLEVMTTVHTLGEFRWTSCNDPGCGTNAKHGREKEKVHQTVPGPDAQAPPWSFPVEDRGEEIDVQPLRRPVTQRVTRSAVALGSSVLPPPSPRASRSSEHGSPISKKRKRDGEEANQEKNRDRDEAYQDRHDITAQNLVQHAWAQAVRVDGTVIVLHSGNHELVCLRHRRSQTLYVSNIIIPSTCPEPGYGKLHVGIYVAAIQDMMDRWWQQSESMPPGDGGDLISGGEDQEDQDHNRGSGSDRKDGYRRGRCDGRRRTNFNDLDTELVAIEKVIDVAGNRDVVLLYFQYDIYDSPTPASFLRSAPPIMAHTRRPFSPRALHSYGLEECLTIVLTSEIGRGATGVVHRGTLKPEMWDGAMPLDVVVKLAFDSEQRDALRSEYEVYRHLKSNEVHQGITTALGIFDDFEGCACALVLLYAGVPLSESQANLSISDCRSAMSTLKCIHCAGILHGDIRQGNILIGDLGVTITDFGHSEQCDNQEAKDEELAQLRACLPL